MKRLGAFLLRTACAILVVALFCGGIFAGVCFSDCVTRMGLYKGLVLLVDFPDADRQGMVPPEEIGDFFNQPGYSGSGNNGSLRDYFLDVSGGKFDYSCEVSGHYFRAPNSVSYYADNREAVRGLIAAALDDFRATNPGFDFSILSADGGKITGLTMIYAGTRTGSWLGANANAGVNYTFAEDGVTLTADAYLVMPAGNSVEPMMLHIPAHETGHMIMGWKDAYDDAPPMSPGTGFFDLYGGTYYAGTEINPVPPNPAFRDGSGWCQVTDLYGAQPGTYPVEANSNKIYRYINPERPEERFYIEAVAQTGRRQNMPGQGLLIWHVDASVDSNGCEKRTPDCHYMIGAEQADGRYDIENDVNGGDPLDFFYDGNNSSFGSNTVPDSRLWTDADSGLDITRISPAGNTMSFVIPAAATPTMTPTPRIAAPGMLNLQLKNGGINSCAGNHFGANLRIENNGSDAVALDTLQVKMWFYSENSLNANGCWGGELRDAGGNYLGGLQTNSITVAQIPACTDTAGRWANRAATVSFAAGLSIPAGGYLEGVYLQLYRDGWVSPFDEGCNDYTKAESQSYSEDKHVALYRDGVLIREYLSTGSVDELTGVEPCGALQPTPTMTPQATAMATFTQTPRATWTMTATPRLTATATPTGVPASLRVQYFSYNTQPSGNTIYVNFRVFNGGQEAVQLADLALKYWYTFEGTDSPETVDVDWAGVYPGAGQISAFIFRSIKAIAQGGQTRVLAVGFAPAAGSLQSGAVAEIKLRIHRNDWGNYIQTNDYSFGTQSWYEDWEKTTAYTAGTLKWGIEPGTLTALEYSKTPAAAESISAENTYNYPNPCSESTIIRFSLSEAGPVNINISDPAGKTVKTIALAQSATRAGINSVAWDLSNDFGADVSNGVYLLNVAAEGKVIMKKIAVVR